VTELALDTWPALLAAQAGAVSRDQARQHGQSDGAIAAHLAARRWQRAATSVYVTFTGPLPVETRRWVALLAAGPGAVLSHETAAELWGLRPLAHGPIQVTVSAVRTVAPPRGVRVHRSRRLARSTHPNATPPRTTVEATVLDLAARAVRLDDALALVTRACQSKLTNSAKLASELKQRRTQPWRRFLVEAVLDAAGGAHSLLELRYLRDVERAHGLPKGRRQRAVANTFQDVSYDGFATVVELDGRKGHEDADGRWRDMTRDNASAARGETTLRYGWADVTARPCAVAAQVAGVLRARGWRGSPRKCVGSCEL
jgi:very-short-patch-repair endonuclease